MAAGALALGAEFQVAQYPGDNYRMAAYGDVRFLQELRNLDQYDGLAIVDQKTGSLADCKAIDPKYASPVLTVWRTLHIEYDEMRRALDNPPFNENLDVRDAFFTDFEQDASNTNKIAKIKELINYTASGTPLPLWPNDGSIGDGRFQKGHSKLGNQGFLNNSIAKTDAADVHFFPIESKMPSNSFTCRIIKPGLPGINTDAVLTRNPSAPYFTVSLSIVVLDFEDYEGAQVYLGGAVNPQNASTLISINGSESQFNLAAIQVPVWLKDDDYLGNLPYEPTPEVKDVAQYAYAKAYIDAVFDGGGDLGFVQSNLDFLVNLPDLNSPQFIQNTYYEGPASVANARALENDDYWVANLIFGWQAEKEFDGDPGSLTPGPSSENVFFGITPLEEIPSAHCNVTDGWDISYICIEPHRDIYFPQNIDEYIANTVTHEVGHQFGLTHGYPFDDTPPIDCASCILDCSEVGLMTGGITIPLNNDFIPLHINLLRSRKKTPRHQG